MTYDTELLDKLDKVIYATLNTYYFEGGRMLGVVELKDFNRKKDSHLALIMLVIISILFIIPSFIYLLKNGTIAGFKTYYNFFINEKGIQIYIGSNLLDYILFKIGKGRHIKCKHLKKSITNIKNCDDMIAAIEANCKVEDAFSKIYQYYGDNLC